MSQHKLGENLAALMPAVFFIVLLALVLLYTFPTASRFVKPWYNPVVTPSEVDAALWVNNNIPARSHFAADLFDCEMLVSAGNMVCAIGGDWELASNSTDRFYDDDQLFSTPDALYAWQLLHKYDISYVFVTPRYSYYGFGWKEPDWQKFDNLSYFTPVYSVNGVQIYLVDNNTRG